MSVHKLQQLCLVPSTSADPGCGKLFVSAVVCECNMQTVLRGGGAACRANQTAEQRAAVAATDAARHAAAR